jgi:hypothetical protein
VVILGIVLEDLGLLVVVEGAGEVIKICFFAPFFTINEPNRPLEFVVLWEVE